MGYDLVEFCRVWENLGGGFVIRVLCLASEPLAENCEILRVFEIVDLPRNLGTEPPHPIVRVACMVPTRGRGSVTTQNHKDASYRLYLHYIGNGSERICNRLRRKLTVIASDSKEVKKKLQTQLQHP